LQVEMRAGSGPQEHEHRAAALLASKFRAWMPGWLAPREARAEVSGFRLDVTEDLNRGTLGIVPTLRARAHYAGGFIERIELRADAWMTTGLDLFRKAPIRRVELLGIRPFHWPELDPPYRFYSMMSRAPQPARQLMAAAHVHPALAPPGQMPPGQAQ